MSLINEMTSLIYGYINASLSLSIFCRIFRIIRSNIFILFQLLLRLLQLQKNTFYINLLRYIDLKYYFKFSTFIYTEINYSYIESLYFSHVIEISLLNNVKLTEVFFVLKQSFYLDKCLNYLLLGHYISSLLLFVLVFILMPVSNKVSGFFSFILKSIQTTSSINTSSARKVYIIIIMLNSALSSLFLYLLIYKALSTYFLLCARHFLLPYQRDLLPAFLIVRDLSTEILVQLYYECQILNYILYTVYY